MADFHMKSAIFQALARSQIAAVSTAQGSVAPKMAELLMNPAIPSEESMRTSWAALRNGYYANQNGYQ